jgi:hypothetical protein
LKTRAVAPIAILTLVVLAASVLCAVNLAPAAASVQQTGPARKVSDSTPSGGESLAPARIFIPFVSHDQCSLSSQAVSPFSIQIAALDQVRDRQGADLPGWPSAQAERPVLSAEAFSRLREALRESGAGWARVRIGWLYIQPDPPPAEYAGWSYNDEQLGLLAETGVRLIATVADAPSWAADSPCAPIHLDRLDDFGQFLSDLVNRYKQPPYNIKHWELFNEPDGTWPSGWAGGLGCWAKENSDEDGLRYRQMLATAYAAIKDADPEATVLMGGVAYDWFTAYGGPFDRYFPDDVMAYGGGYFLDVLNFHYFPDFRAEWERWQREDITPTCGIVDDGVGTAYEVGGIDLIAKTNHFRNRMSACYSVDKPIWVTEMAEHGYASDHESLVRQARYVVQGYARGLAAGVENITWYALHTPNDTYEQGLLFDDWTPKPAFYAYRTLTAELSGYEYAYTPDAENVEGYTFRTPCGQEKTVAWGTGAVIFTPAEQLRVVDREGNGNSVKDGGPGDRDGMQNGAVELQLSLDPVFVMVREGYDHMASADHNPTREVGIPHSK